MASPWQTIRQIRHVVGAAAWPDSPAATVIGQHSAVITAGVEEDQQLPARLPFVLLNLGAETADASDPNLLTQEVIMVPVVQVEGHDLGEYHIIGGASHESSRAGYSTGRGILEVENVLLSAVGRLTGADGAPITVTYASGTNVQPLRGGWCAFRQFTLSAVCTRADEYPAPRNFTATGGVGQIVCAWDLPPSRFDLLNVSLRYASGATAPTSVSGGSGASLSSALATSKTISGLAAGTYSLALFAGYDETQPAGTSPATAGRYSSQDVGSYRTSVVVS